MLWRLEVFVEGTQLEYVLWTLAGHAVEVRTPQPVVNAAKKNGKVHAKVANGDKIELFREWIKERKLTEVNSTLAREFCKSVGTAETSYTYMLGKARDVGLLKKTGKGTKSVWKVVA